MVPVMLKKSACLQETFEGFNKKYLTAFIAGDVGARRAPTSSAPEKGLLFHLFILLPSIYHARITFYPGKH
jgi:hypothetical protein